MSNGFETDSAKEHEDVISKLERVVIDAAIEHQTISGSAARLLGIGRITAATDALIAAHKAHNDPGVWDVR